MVEGKCERCGKTVSSNAQGVPYKFCIKCNSELQKEKSARVEINPIKGGSDNLLDALNKINTNLYAIRTLMEFKLKQKGFELKTNQETKRFEVLKIRKVRK